MKNAALFPDDHVYWYLSQASARQVTNDIQVDVAVVGGGMAGLSAAQCFRQKGFSVALLEKTYCGAGASGKSSGFITSNSEFALIDFIRLFGKEAALQLWQFAESGVAFIKKNIEDFGIHADYQVQDTLVVATNDRKFRRFIETEHHARQEFSYPSKLYVRDTLAKLLNSPSYSGGIIYGNSFGINGYLYCQGMKRVLGEHGVDIYEETPVIGVDASGLRTPGGLVKADQIVFCIDRFLPELGKLTHEIYHAQTFLMMSSPLSDANVQKIFPERPVMVWDTDLIYHYYRLAGQNRLLLGGGSLWSTYARQAQHDNEYMYKSLNNYAKSAFPEVDITFEYMWPGLIGITKDIMPIAGPDRDLKNIYYVSGAAGLPWAAALGKYAAESIVDKKSDLDTYFSPYRRFPLGRLIQAGIGTQLTFALSNFSQISSL